MLKQALVGLGFFVLSAHGYECGVITTSNDTTITENICDESDVLVTQLKRIKKDNRVISRSEFVSGLISRSFSFNYLGAIVVENRWEHQSDNKFIKTSAYHPSKEINSRKLYKKINDKNILLATFGLDRKKNKLDDMLVTHIDYLNQKNDRLVDYRFALNEDGDVKKKIVFHYENDKAFSFEIFNTANIKIGGYNHKTQLNIESIYQDDENLDFKLAQFNDENRVKVALIDSGVDHLHKDLAYKLWNNPADPKDGIDNDGNGLVDDTHGWMTPLNIGLPIETINTNDGIVPNSHGTHVSSIFAKDVDDIAIIPFVGDYGESYFLDIMNKEFTSKNVEFANMSFSFPHPRRQMVARSTYRSLQKLISNNEHTLFFVASGNDGIELGVSTSNSMYPVCYQYENMMTIGAIDTNEIIEADMPNYKAADYSNLSARYVDILAPGTKVNGASLGGGDVKHTGTSMATPWALNIALKIKTKYPQLENHEIKKIIMLSAYIPNIDEPFEVKSGGMIFPRRANALAKLFTSFNNDLSPYELAWQVRIEVIMEGESIDQNYKSKILSLWNDRGI